MTVFPRGATVTQQDSQSGTTCCCVCVPQASVGIVEVLGKFDTVYPPGFTCINPFTTEVDGLVSLRLRTMKVEVSSITSEKSTVTAICAVMYRVIPSQVHVSYYSLNDPAPQIRSYVENSLRGQLPMHSMNELFALKSEIADRARAELAQQLPRYGYEVVDLLLQDFVPSYEVKAAITNTVTERYKRQANAHLAEMNRSVQIRHSEAEAECARLSGVGAAEMQKAQTAGLDVLLQKFYGGDQTSEMMAMILMQQYMDTLVEVEDAKGGNVVFTAEKGMLRQRATA
jgi:regulator of protease activity HflC (stomatin/prohibitin superfamily)